MFRTNRITAALALALTAAVSGAASAQTYLGGEVMLQDEAGFTYWGDPNANAYWGSSDGGTLNDYTDWGTNPSVHDYQELHVVPDSYWDTGDNSGWDSWSGSTWDAPSEEYSYDYGYGAENSSSNLYDW